MFRCHFVPLNMTQMNPQISKLLTLNLSFFSSLQQYHRTDGILGDVFAIGSARDMSQLRCLHTREMFINTDDLDTRIYTIAKIGDKLINTHGESFISLWITDNNSSNRLLDHERSEVGIEVRGIGHISQWQRDRMLRIHGRQADTLRSSIDPEDMHTVYKVIKFLRFIKSIERRFYCLLCQLFYHLVTDTIDQLRRSLIAISLGYLYHLIDQDFSGCLVSDILHPSCEEKSLIHRIHLHQREGRRMRIDQCNQCDNMLISKFGNRRDEMHIDLMVFFCIKKPHYHILR